ncbi:hypothetical protein PIB30_088412 [Stylosanthes scabra]|uniref:Uncharacterized protein n=1 Tax=Stylosanthes scabra TaxID=79078 RepID=A0ABU6ZSD8_9FABA|nr:hypothetical protein [Stylosanthes scabra]
MGWGFSLRIFIRLFRYRFKLGKLAKYLWNSECLAFSEVEVLRYMSWRTRDMFATWLIGFGALHIVSARSHRIQLLCFQPLPSYTPIAVLPYSSYQVIQPLPSPAFHSLATADDVYQEQATIV